MLALCVCVSHFRHVMKSSNLIVLMLRHADGRHRRHVQRDAGGDGPPDQG